MTYESFMKQLEKIPSNFNENTFEMFWKFVPNIPPGKFVDFGTGRAKSVVGIAMLNPNLDITTFDPGVPYETEWEDSVRRTLADFSVWSGRITFSKGDSRTFPWDESDSLVGLNIDSSHEYELTRDEIARWVPFVEKNGLIFLDDYLVDHVDVKRAVDESFLRDETRYKDLNPGGMCCVFQKL